jgi:hypothetical protein
MALRPLAEEPAALNPRPGSQAQAKPRAEPGRSPKLRKISTRRLDRERQTGAGQPAPRRAGAKPPGRGVPGTPPPGHDRAQPVRAHAQELREQIIRGAIHLTAQQQPGNITLTQTHAARVSAAG